MTRLFAQLYLDEDVSVLVADLLRARGFTAVTTREAGNLGQSDQAQLRYSVAHEMAILTHNRSDFEELHQQWLTGGLTHWGIIIAVRRRPPEMVGRLLRLLNLVTADELSTQLLYV